MVDIAQALQINGRFVSLPTDLFINGKLVAHKQGARFDLEDPATGKTLISVTEGREDDVDEAVRVTRQVFHAGDRSASNPADRGALLNYLADVMDQNIDRLIAVGDKQLHYFITRQHSEF
ncbi:hypothetical protein BJX68DRAFT_272906 [Aspergillus pseudodeflectus]|uniref:Aldehyde dehydrogenase domain-containing protein n=1 Tax=Aspergillus pseudodeflectus TaxID=176178 RepID=A0ABR4JD66_9EURO